MAKRTTKSKTPEATEASAAKAQSAAKSEVKGSGTRSAAPAAPAAAREISHEMIAKRAYDIYASRGYAPGNPEEDWREAERLLRAGL